MGTKDFRASHCDPLRFCRNRSKNPETEICFAYLCNAKRCYLLMAINTILDSGCANYFEVEDELKIYL